MAPPNHDTLRADALADLKLARELEALGDPKAKEEAKKLRARALGTVTRMALK